MISEREKNILRVIVEEYIKTAKPVSSSHICNKLKCSSATIRNEMVYLENQDIEIQNGSTIKITTKILKENNYISDLYDTNHELCTGYIIYSKQDDGYSYNPYIKCGNIYQTKGYIN